MAMKQTKVSSKDREICPRCGAEALIINARTIKWLTCPKCKFKKLLEKKPEPIKVTPLLEKD